jgi:hypothetical protein
VSTTTLALPAFSIGEAYEASIRRKRERDALYQRSSDEMVQRGRSRPRGQAPADSQELTALLLRVGEEEKARLDDALQRVLSVATILPTSTRQSS